MSKSWLLLLSAPPSTDKGGGEVRHLSLRTPAEWYTPPPHLASIQTHWLICAPPLNQQISQLYGSRPQIRALELCVYVGEIE